MSLNRHLTRSTFKGRNLYAIYWVYDNEKGEGWEDEVLVDDVDILPFLARTCTIDPDTSLIDILEAVKSLSTLWDPIFQIDFQAHLNHYYENVDTPITTEYGPDEYLQVYKGVHAQRYTDQEEYELDDHVGFHLIKPSEDIPYAIDFEPLHHFARLPVRLKTTIEITITDVTDTKITQKVNVEYTLWEIVYGILWEIGFHGSPSDKGGKRDELMERVDELENMTAEQLDALPRHFITDQSNEK